MAISDQERSAEPRRAAVSRRVVEVRRRRAVAVAVVVVLTLAVVVAIAGSGGARHIPPLLGPNAPPPALLIDPAREAAALDQAAAEVPYVTGAGPGRRLIALTFDDGPGPYTPDVLRVLKAAAVPATFFVVGRGIADFGPALDEEISRGFVVGDHTQDHRSMGTLSPTDQAQEIQGVTAALAQRGVTPRLFRPPSRSFNAATLTLLRANRMLMVLWSVDTADYTMPGTQAIVRSALKGARPGAIILMHDGGGDRRETVVALPQIIRRLRARGYQLVTVPQLLAEDPPAISAVPRGSSAGA